MPTEVIDIIDEMIYPGDGEARAVVEMEKEEEEERVG